MFSKMMDPFAHTAHVPLLFVNESSDALMRHAPPYGFKFQMFQRTRLEEMKRNAWWEPLPRAKSCAVVGNSGILRQRRDGALVDAHDLVFRVNHAPTTGYEPHVGNKTDYHVSASHWMREKKEHPSRSFLVVCDRPYVYSCQNAMFATRRPGVQMINPLFYREVRTFAGDSKIPLTGFVAVSLALRLCDRVRLFGFSVYTPRKNDRVCEYYYACARSAHWYNTRRGNLLFHDFAAHRKTLQEWASRGIVLVDPPSSWLGAVRSRNKKSHQLSNTSASLRTHGH